MENKMRMQIFETFILEFCGVRLDEKEICSKKLTRLLTYLIINRDRTLSQQELINVFWEDDSRNPAGALKNLMYRLRKVLGVFGEAEYICTIQGGYRWSPEIPVETDYEQFARSVEQIRTVKEMHQRKELCKAAIGQYRGDLCPELVNEGWLLPSIVRHQSLYMDTIKELCSIYEKEESWNELEILCSKALSADSLEEDIYYWMIKSLYKQNKNDLAIYHYEKASRRFYDNLGVRNMEKLQAAFREIKSESGQKETDINKLFDEMIEQEKPQGAYICEYQTFCQIYRIEARKISRLGISEYVLLLTVEKKNGSHISSSGEGIEYGMDILKGILGEGLRAGDLAARYSFNQYIVLLSGCCYETGRLVAERLQKQFRDRSGKKELVLQFNLKEI